MKGKVVQAQTARQGYRPGNPRRNVVGQLSIGPMNDEAKQPVGLIAGWGRFPVLVAEALMRKGHPVFCVALQGLADPALEYYCDNVRWLGVAKLGGHIRYFRRNHVHHVTMAGKLFKAELLFHGSVILKNWPDWECVRTFAPHFIFRKQDTRDDSLLTAVTNAYSRAKMNVIAATDFAPDLLVKQGSLTSRRPSAGQWSDIQFGWQIAKMMGGLDIGQAITVRNGTVIAVEAVEGTDACIARSGKLCKKGGWTLIKVSKPNQDMRFDVPTIGPLTIQQVADAGGSAIAIEAGKTIVVDQHQTIQLAEKLGISLIAIEADSVAATSAGNFPASIDAAQERDVHTSKSQAGGNPQTPYQLQQGAVSSPIRDVA